MRKLASEFLMLFKRPLGRRRFDAAISIAADPIRLELGAWTTERSGWISTDVHWRSRYYLDATRIWPIARGSVAYIYADNVIEHLTISQNRFLFREAYRVLCPGGRIRLVTPDVETLATIYLQRSNDAKELTKELRAQGYSIQHDVDLLRFAFQDDGHDQGYLWDREALVRELRDAGFSSFEVHSAGQSNDPELRNLELRFDNPVADIGLHLEAMK